MSATKSLFRQKLARQRMLSARGLSSPERTTKKEAPPPMNEMRVNLLSRVAEYRAKGWINEEEESDYQQLLTNGPNEFGGNTDQVALQVQKALDLAKAKESSKKNISTAPTNSRSLFRKPAASSTTDGASTEMTLQKKLSHRRKSRMGTAHHASPQPAVENADKRDDSSSKRDTTESKELAIVEAMFGNAKRDDKTKENDETSTPSDKRNERLARARNRRRTSFSPDAVNTKPKKEVSTTQQDKPTSTEVQNVEGEASEKPSVSVETAKRLFQSTGSSRRSVFNKSPRALQQEAPTMRLSQSNSTAERESLETSKVSLHVKTASPRRSVFSKSPRASQEEAPTMRLSQSNSTAESESLETSKVSPQVKAEKPSVSIEAAKRLFQSAGSPRRSVFNKSPTASQQGAHTIRLSQSSSAADESESVETSKVSPHVKTESPRLSSPSMEAAKRLVEKAASKRSIYFQSSKTLNQDSLGETPTISLSQSSSTVEQENHDPGIKKINGESRRDESRHQVLKEAPTLFRKAPKTVKTSKVPVICAPRELWSEKNAVQSEEALRDLFVEMAFFARLGFVEPPSCLHCVYRESIENMTPNLACKRFVPWRKDANTPIHPHQLDDNIMLIQCHAARSLVQGESVNRYRFDKIKRKLVCQQ